MSTVTMPTSSDNQTALAPNLRVYNTLSREKEPFTTVTPGKVGMYLCGPTVYDKAHMGHMVGPVIFDCIKRYLAYSGFEVKWVVNITDVDDKLIAKSKERGIPMAEVATEMTADYVSNLQHLGVDQIDEMPKATEHMQHIIDFIAQLIEHGFAYESEGDVYFEVGKDSAYGKLSNRNVEESQGEGGETAGRKRAPGDFALWKTSKPGEPSWESPWGNGRPGWHIECSAMSKAILGETFDIHGGGLDLVFPHHENEIAQSECCHSAPMAKFWMHNGLMRAGTSSGKMGGRGDREEQADVNTKMSRSKGAGGLAELIERQTGERIRFFLLRTHYRSTIVFGEDGLAEAGTALETFHRFFERAERVIGESFYSLAAPTNRNGFQTALENATVTDIVARRDGFLVKMDDDFNTGAAISELFDLVRTLNKFADAASLEDANARNEQDVATFKLGVTTLRELTQVLGLFREPPQKDSGGDDALVGKLVDLLIQIRKDARANKDFATSDRVRDELAAMGVVLEDRKGETTWRLE